MRNYDADMTAELIAEVTAMFFLLEFQLTSGTYRYTDRDVSVFYSGNRYYPINFKFNNISISGSMSVDNVSLTIDNIDRVFSGILLGEDCRNKPVVIRFGARRKPADVMTEISQYPPVHNATYVKSTNEYPGGLYAPHLATNPASSLIGSWESNAWVTEMGINSQQRFHIDLGTSKIVDRIYYENSHHIGALTDCGANNFILQGSNNAAAFAELTYATDTNWTTIQSGLHFDQHIENIGGGSEGNVADPKYITITNSTAYRYYAIKIADNWGNANVIGIRRIALQAQEPVEQAEEDLVEDLFTGLLAGWDIEGDSTVNVEVVNEFVLWNKKTLRKHSASCPWSFRGTECGYGGSGLTICDKTYDTCNSLGNGEHFGGFRFLPSIQEKETWWGVVKGD